MYVRMYVGTHVCTYVCMYARMSAGVCVCVCVHERRLVQRSAVLGADVLGDVVGALLVGDHDHRVEGHGSMSRPRKPEIGAEREIQLATPEPGGRL